MESETVSRDAVSIASALKDAESRYQRKHGYSQKSHHEALQYMPGGNTRSILHTKPFPLTISHGESCYLTTVDGHKYIDFLGEYTAAIYGHNNAVIRKAVEQALDNGWSYGGQTRIEQVLAKTVCERFPAMEKVRFVNSGTEANMMALATAVAYTGKKTILIFRKSYHGGTISGKGSPDKLSINLPHDFVIGEYNDVEGTSKLINSLPQHSLAAILVEPLIGSGGCFAGQSLFLHFLRDIATHQQALLIFDEVMTSRLSYQGYGATFDIVPDMMTLGKWVGGGMTFGAFGGRKGIMDLYDPRKGKLDHPGTFNNNVFTMNAGVAGCRLLDREKIANLNALGDSMREAINTTLQRHCIEGGVPQAPLRDSEHTTNDQNSPARMFVTGVGSLMNVHFTGPDHDTLQALFFHHMLDCGIYIAQRGFIALNIEITQSHVETFIKAVDSFCQKWGASLQR